MVLERKEPEGRPPAPRALHTASFLSSRYLAIYGGKNERIYTQIRNIALNDVCLYDVEKNCWEALAMFGNVPSSRWGHAMCSHEGRLIVLGGINLKSYCSGNAKVFDTSNARAIKRTILIRTCRGRQGDSPICEASRRTVAISREQATKSGDLAQEGKHALGNPKFLTLLLLLIFLRKPKRN